MSDIDVDGTKAYRAYSMAEQELLKNALQEARSKLREALTENERLVAERESSEREAYAAAELLRSGIQKREESIRQLQDLTGRIESESKAAIEDIKQKAACSLNDLQASADKREALLSDEIAVLRKELADLESFKQNKADIEKLICSFAEEREAIERRAKEEKTKLERNFFEETTRLRRDCESRLERQKLTKERECDKHLENRVKQIIAENRRYAVDLSLHKQETETLRREVSDLESENRRLEEEVVFKDDLEEHLAKRSAEQGALAKTLRSQVSTLESSMKQLLISTNRQRDELVRKHKRFYDDARVEIEGLKKLVMIKSRENWRLKNRLDLTLRERTDIEKFIVSSIYKVRSEVQQEETGFVGCDNLFLKNVEDMNWEERERVLKELFNMINKKKVQKAEAAKGGVSKEGPADPT